MDIRLRPGVTIRALICIADVVFLWLCLGAGSIQAQDVNWLPESGVDPTNWFDRTNWEPSVSTAPQRIPTATDIASVNTTTLPESDISAIATVGLPGAVAQQLLIGATITSGGITPSTLGEVIVNGTGASLTLSGPDSLQVINGSLLIENGGTLTAQSATIGTAGVTTPGSVGAVTVNGTGASLTLSGPGSLQVVNGSLLVENGGTLTAQAVTIGTAGQINIGNGGPSGTFNALTIANEGAINFNFSDSTTLSAQVSGSGLLLKQGTGTLILTGANTYTGETVIAAGTLQIGNGGTTGSIVGNVADNGTLAFDRSDSVTFGGMMTGTGDVVKLGTGTLTLVGTNTYTGTTTVNSGSLIIDGSIASGQTVVNSAGFLGGHGTINGNVVNSGIVGQINSPGTLTVKGNYTQSAGGTLQIGIGGTQPFQNDLLAVTGHAAVAGTLQIVSLGNFSLQPGNQITVLSAGQGVSGAFNTTQNGLVNTGTIVQVSVTTLADSVVLQATQGSFDPVATTPNQLAVANALNSAAGDPRAAALFAFLDSQPLANLPHDLDLIAPAAISSINATAVSLGKVQITNLSQRLSNIRGGSTGFSSSGFSINGGAVSYDAGFAGVSGPEGKSGPSVLAPTPDNRWGVFLTGLGEFTNVDGTSNAAGYNVDTGGFTFGVDYRLTPNVAIGLTGGYAHTSVGPDGGGRIDVNGGKIGLYGTVFGSGFYLDTAVSGGPSGYNTHRAALQGTANGSTDGADFNALVAGGYDWTHGNLSIGPTASFQYSYVSMNSFTETGSLAPLSFPDQNTESERTAFGAKATYEWKIGHVTFIPQVSAAWQHEFGDTAYSIVAGFASGAGNNFTVSGPEIGRDSLLIGAGTTVIWNDRVSTYLYYDGEVARTNYQSHNVSGGVRITF